MESSISYQIRRTSRLLRQNLYTFFQKNEGTLSPEHWIILSKLDVEDGCTQTELSDATLHDKANIGRLVDALEKRKLIERQKHPTDRRKHIVSLTGEGRHLVSELMPAVIKEREDIVADIPVHELQIFVSVLNRIESNLENKIKTSKNRS